LRISCLLSGAIDYKRPNEETNHFARRYFERSEFRDNIRLITGQAHEVIPGLQQQFDLVFIDPDKKNYSLYFDLVIEKVRTGGLILADNVLWSGKVLEEHKDADTAAIHAFNMKIQADSRVENLLLPVRDGLLLIRKL
jgi:caffeoyl-CoA O-methyltransferase